MKTSLSSHFLITTPSVIVPSLVSLPPSELFKLRVFLYKNLFCVCQPFSLLLLDFFLSTDIETAPPLTRPLYNDLKRRTQRAFFFSPSCPILSYFVLSWLTFVYVIYNPNNNEVYNLKDVSMKLIFSTAWDYCALFDNMAVNFFAKWCLDQKLDVTAIFGNR